VKILVVRFSSIGDVVLTSPVLRAIKNQIPDVEIHFLTKFGFLPLVETNPNLSKVYTIEKSIKEVVASLKMERYDYVIDLHNNVRTLSLKLKLGIKSYSFPKLNFKKWMLVRFKINRMPQKHIVDRYFESISKLGVTNDGRPGELFISAADSVSVMESFNCEENAFLAVAIGAQFQTKQMPIALLKNVLKDILIPIVLIGGKEDSQKASELIQMLPEKRIFSACGKFSLMQSASIVKKAKVLLTGDTGMMHIAACFDRNIVSVWGNTVPELGMYPYLPSKKKRFSIHKVHGLACSPCSKIGYQKCPKGHFKCMSLQNVDAIKNDLMHRINP
jgi:ADP-heptose:LPS heptosyltransferase